MKWYFSLLLVVGCTARRELVTVDLRSPWLDPDGALLRVGSRVLSRGEVYRRILGRFGSKELLRGIAEEEQVRLYAEERGLEISEEEVSAAAQKEYDTWAAAFPDTTSAQRELKAAGLTKADMLRSFEEDVRSELLFEKVVALFRPLDDAAVLQYYRQTYAQDRVLVRRLAFPARGVGGRGSALKLATEAQRRLAASEAWEEVARAYLQPGEAQEPPRAFGGDQWWIGENENYPSELKEAVFALEVGAVSDPLWDEEFAYHVFQVSAAIPAEPFAACVEKMRREIRSRAPTSEETRTVLAELQSRYPFEMLAEARSSEAPKEAAPAPPGGSTSR